MTAPLAHAVAPENDDVIRAIVTRLSRPSPWGGSVIEIAAILAEGAGSDAMRNDARNAISCPPTH